MRGETPSERMVRVLTIEPSTRDRSDLALQLASLDETSFIVQSVSSVAAARTLLSNEHIDCVVCLHDPPSLDGVEVVANLRQDRPDLPVLLASEATTTDSAVNSAATDIVQVSNGDIHPEVVTKRIRSIVSQAHRGNAYEQIFNRANDGIVVHDPETGDVLEANDRLYSMLGYERDGTERLTVGRITAGVDDYTEANVREEVKRTSERGERTIETLLQTVDGDERWVEVSLKPTRVGNEDRVLAFVRDITGRKESEQLLSDREQQLEAVFNHPASFAVVLDENGRVVRANQPALEYVSASAADLEGLQLWETPWWDHDESEAERIRQSVTQAMSGEPVRVVSEIAADTGRRFIDLRFEPADAGEVGSQPIHNIAVGYDITERKTHEEEVKTHRETLRRLHEITANPDLSFDEQVDRILSFGAEQLDLDIGFLSHIDTESSAFEIVAARGDHELLRTGNESDLAETYCRRTIDAGIDAPLAIRDASVEMADDPAYEKFGLGCYLGAEITVNGELYGTLCFADDDPRQTTFSGEEQTLIDLMAQWIRRGLEQRSYQRELEETRDRLARTFERIDDAFFAVDDEWHLTYVNETGASVLRRAMNVDDASELLGKHLWEEVSDAVGTTFHERYQEAMETQESVSFEEYYEPLDVWFEVNAYPDEDGLSVYFTDITERKERERELKTKTKAMETAPVGIILTDPDRDDNPIIYANERFEGMTGYTEAEVVGRNCRLLQGDDTDPDTVAELREAIDDDRPASVELRNYRKDGTAFWNAVTIAPVTDETGTVTNWVGFQQDVTERKEREQELARLQNLLERTEQIADVGGWEIETDTMEVFWSDHLFELLGFGGDEEPTLDEALDGYRAEDRPIVERAVAAAIESGEPFDVTARYQREDDSRWLRVQGVPIVDDGDVVRIRGAAQDVTDRKEREQTLNDLLEATRSFIRASDETELVDAIVAGANEVFGYDISTVRLHDAEAGTLPPTKVSSGATARVSEFPTYDDRESVFGEVFQSGSAMVLDDLSESVAHDYDSVDSGMVLPIDGYGVLSIGAVEAGAFDEEEGALVKLLAIAAASAFDRLDQESEMRHLKRVIDHVGQKIFLLDEDRRFTFVTEPLADYLGTDRDTLAKTRLVDIVSPEDVDTCTDVLADVFAHDRHASRTLEVDLLTASDERLPVELELAPIRETSNRAEIAGVVTDISELAETRSTLETERERFKTLFENLPDPVVETKFVDGEPIVQYVNPAFTDTFGYDRDAALGSNLNALIVPDGELEPATGLDDHAVDGERTSTNAQRETTEGRRDFLLRGIPYSREDGPYGFAVYTDITEQKERERYLQVLNRVLRHNLRNDMNVVMALANRLAENIEDDELAEYARTLEDNAEDVATLSEKAKQIERVLGRRGSETGAIDVVPHLRDVIVDLQNANPDAQLTIDAPDELWIAANEDIRRACVELIENAIEHNEATAPRVSVETRDVPERNDWVELCFHDNGSGIPDAEWDIVAGEEDITPLSHGSGLGLWLTRWIVESYGGEIYRERRENEAGTTVVLRVRRGVPEAPPDGTGQAGIS
ncbi:PAS domain S-box protein [Halopenitus persicus]|uniref:PAS domain S-box protein n=1 Tax=Halopenitus persicus TaxID=1048396 RepID=UPI000BBB2E2C|nr:PAS domain S-box protein [Halopenitus persicus]